MKIWRKWKTYIKMIFCIIISLNIRSCIIYQYSLTTSTTFTNASTDTLWPSISFTPRPAAISQYRKSRRASSCRRQEKERERELKLRANRLRAGESEVGRARTSLLKRSPWWNKLAPACLHVRAKLKFLKCCEVTPGRKEAVGRAVPGEQCRESW